VEDWVNTCIFGAGAVLRVCFHGFKEAWERLIRGTRDGRPSVEVLALFWGAKLRIRLFERLASSEAV
jgi:hypothetical protein